MWLNLILGVLEPIIVACCTFYFMSRIGQELRRKKSVYVGSFFAYSVLIFGAGIAEQYYRIHMLMIICMLIGVVIIGYFVFSRKKTFLAYCIIHCLCIYCCQGAIVMGMLQWYARKHADVSYEFGSGVLVVKYIAIILMTKLFVYLINRSKNGKMSKAQYFGIFLLPIFSILFIYTLISVSSVYIQMYGPGLIALNVAVILIINIYILYLFFHVSRAIRLEHELQLLEQKSELQFQYYAELEEKYQGSRKIVHDMRNHLYAIEELYENGGNQGKQYVEDLHQMLNELGQQYYTNNHMLNIILNDKVKLAKQKEIEIDVKIGDICLERMRDIDITTIFANLLDNAIEAAQHAEKKFIEIKADRIHDFNIVKITNSKKENYKKKNHMGIGIQNVKKALEMYEGTLQIKEEMEIYQSVVTIPKM